LEQEFIQNQEQFRPQEEKTQVQTRSSPTLTSRTSPTKRFLQEERSKVDDIRGSPLAVGTLEEIIDDNHAIVSTAVGPEYYVPIMSFVDRDQIEPGCSVLLHNKVRCYLPNT